MSKTSKLLIILLGIAFLSGGWGNGWKKTQAFAQQNNKFPSWMDEVDFSKPSSPNSRIIDLDFAPSRFQTKVKSQLPDFKKFREKAKKTETQKDVNLEKRLIDLFSIRDQKELELQSTETQVDKALLANELKTILDEINYIRTILSTAKESTENVIKEEVSK